MSDHEGWEWRLRRPDWPEDEFSDAKTIAWITLIDAMKKSVLCNDLGRMERLSSSESAIKDMILAREWLTTDGIDGSVTRDLCLQMLSISKMVLFGTLRGLWLRLGKDVASTIAKKLEAVTGHSRASRRDRRNITSVYERELLIRAAEVVKRTNKIVGA